LVKLDYISTTRSIERSLLGPCPLPNTSYFVLIFEAF
jgi:hypothetical protein